MSDPMETFVEALTDFMEARDTLREAEHGGSQIREEVARGEYASRLVELKEAFMDMTLTAEGEMS